MYRSRKTLKAYNPVKNTTTPQDDASCPFCVLDDRTVHFEGETMRVIPNKYPYEIWDNLNVIDHLMLVPKRHIESLGELTETEKVEAIDLIARYEAAGYNVYGRSKGNSTRSVPHQHTHLIKVEGRPPRLSVYSRRPYFIWKV